MMVVVGQKWKPKLAPAVMVYSVVAVSRGMVDLVRPTNDGKIYETIKLTALIEGWERVK